MKKILTVVLLTLSLTVFTSTAFAYIYATNALVTFGTNGGIDPSRSDINNALGAPDSEFLSLGLGGAAVFDFGQAFSGPVSIWETTYDANATPSERAKYPEYAQIYVGNTWSTDFSSFSLVAEINNTDYPTTINLTGSYQYLLIRDVTNLHPDGKLADGFDVNAVGVTPVPIPGALWLLGSGLLGLFGFRRSALR